MKNNYSKNESEISNHILPSSANLLGVCFIIFSLVSALGKPKESLIDELAIVGVFIFLGSSIFSYLSLRSKKNKESLEKIADLVFIFGLLLLTCTALVLAYDINH